MEVEILYTAARRGARPIDVLLVHGSFCGAWVWEPHVMPYLAEQGYNVHAVSLRGHGERDASPVDRTASLADYVADLQTAVARIGRPLAVVGHSLGGAVVQAAISAGARFAGTALIASVPPSGMLLPSQRMFWSHPRLWFELSRMTYAGLRDADPEILRHGLFDNRVSKAEFERLMPRFCDESPAAIFELMGLRCFGAPPSAAGQVLVMGGSRDWFISEADNWQTATWYGTKPVIVPGLSHAVMLDPDWIGAAAVLRDWLDGIAGVHATPVETAETADAAG